MKIAYFGGAPIGKPVLETLLEKNIKPSLVISSPDRPSGRGQKLQENDLKIVASKNSIPTFQPETLKDKEALSPLLETEWDLFVVVAYPNILPQWLIDIPKHGTINLHPSLLPKYRGVSPIRSAILNNDRQTGVSVMLLDAEMDHGPVLAQASIEIEEQDWPIKGGELDEKLTKLGGELLAETIPNWLDKKIKPTEQNHSQATYTKKFDRFQGELPLDPFNLPSGQEAYQVLLKIRAFDGFPGTFFFHTNKRIKVLDAQLSANKELEILSVRPEGKGTVDFDTWLSSQKN